MSDEVIVAASRDELAALAAETMARAIALAVEKRGRARIALSGGSTPIPAYQRLAGYDLPWASTEWFWVDERAVAPDAPRSNYRVVADALRLGDGRIPAGSVHRMEGEAEDLDAAARRYEVALRRSFGVARAVAFDVMTLGVGDDGHTASLFPGGAEVDVDDRLVAAVAARPELGLEARLTLTAPVIAEASLAVMIVAGASKRGPIAAARAAGDVRQTPARLVQRVRGGVVWVLDQEAAG